MKIPYFKELDGIRGIAALMVMFYHFFFKLESNNSLMHFVKKITHFGQSGVSLFFVLSGFLITRILLATKDNPHYFSHFYLRRSLRIFPLYYLFLAIFYFLIPLVKKAPIDSFSLQAPYWIYLQDFALTFNWASSGPTYFWSLAVEEHFYLFWPIMVYYFNNKKIVYSILIIILTATATRWLLIDNNYESRYFTFSRMDELAMGAFLAILEIKGKLSQVKTNAKTFLLLFVISAIPVLVFWSGLTAKSPHYFLQITKFLILGFAYFSFIGFIITSGQNMFIKKALRHGSLTYTGRISYGLYVYHPLCFWAITHFLKINNIAFSLVFSFALSYIVASASFYLFEKRLLNLKKYFEYKTADS